MSGDRRDGRCDPRRSAGPRSWPAARSGPGARHATAIGGGSRARHPRASGSRAARRSRRRPAATRSAPRTGPPGVRRTCNRRATGRATRSCPRPRPPGRRPASPRRRDTGRRRAARAARWAQAVAGDSRVSSHDHRLDAEMPSDGRDRPGQVARRRGAVVIDTGARPARPRRLDRTRRRTGRRR